MDKYSIYREQIEGMSDEELEQKLRNLSEQDSWNDDGWALDPDAARPNYVPTAKDKKDTLEKLKIVCEEVKRRNPERRI